MAEIGDNSGTVNAGHLKAFIERVESINSEIKDRNEDKAAIFSEAKSSGYDTKAMKEVVKLRAMDRDKRVEHETLVDLYRSAIGGLS
jgi:uncharacterized protein (UPF0335 family)